MKGITEPDAVSVAEVEDVVARDRPGEEKRVPVCVIGSLACPTVNDVAVAQTVILTVVVHLRLRVRIPVKDVRPPTELPQLPRQIPRVVVRLADEEDAALLSAQPDQAVTALSSGDRAARSSTFPQQGFVAEIRLFPTARRW